ncbi:caspase family protein [Altericista sp. CCNU0014]|uniref:caspase family protein n=1 Tax=Altericista sp. CCNU0014 TaxID=3082949 RepID=UPI00384DA3FD
MPLSVEQLVHTNFSGVGSRTLTSSRMPEAIQQSFMQAIVLPYRKDPALLRSHTRVGYIHQLAPDELLFGWVYCDESVRNPDELIFTFICYYSTQPLDAPQLELISKCLENGPATPLDRLENGTLLESLTISDSLDYDPTRAGVPIPSSTTALNRLLLYKKKLLHCMVPFEEPQQSQTRQNGDRSVVAPTTTRAVGNPQRQMPRDIERNEPKSPSVLERYPLPESFVPRLSSKFALLIGISEHGLGIQPLPGVKKDVESLRQVLSNPKIGNFAEVDTALNLDSPTMAARIEHFLSNSPPESLALLYFSGYAILDRQGTLCLSTSASRRNAQGKIVRSTFVSTDFLGAVMQDCPARQLVLILDVCITKEDPLHQPDLSKPFETVRQQLSGLGQTILVSSTGIHDTGVQKGVQSSVYTYYLVEGLKSGIADAKSTGIISLGEWHAYAKQKVQVTSPALRPTLYGLLEQKQIQIAQASLDDPRLLFRREVERFSRKGQISLVNKLILDDLQKNLGLQSVEASKIKAEVLKPYKEYQNKLRQYARIFLSRTDREVPAKSNSSSQQISYLQDSLGLTDVDTEPIRAEILRQLSAIQIPVAATAGALALEGRRPSRQRRSRSYAQASSAIQGSLAHLASEANRWTNVARQRLATLETPHFTWNAVQSWVAVRPGKVAAGVLAGLMGLFVVSTSLFNARQKQEQSQQRQTLETLIQQQKYDECETFGKALPQSLKLSDPVQLLLQQCQTGLRWKNAAVRPVAQPSSAVWALAFAPKGQTLAVGREDGKIQLWNVATQQLNFNLQGHPDRLWSVAFNSDGTQVASAGGDRAVKLWDVASGNRIHRFKGHQNTVWSVAFTSDGSFVASGSEDGTVKLWNAGTGTLHRTLNPESGAIRAIALGPDGRTLVSAGASKDITVWDIETGKPSLTLTGHTDRVIALAIGGNGTLLASGSTDKTIKIWNLQDGTLLRSIDIGSSSLQTLAFSPDKETIASGIGSAARLWNVQTGQFIYQFSGSPSNVTATAFSSDGQMLAISRENKLLSVLKH